MVTILDVSCSKLVMASNFKKKLTLKIKNFNNDTNCNEYIIEQESFNILRWLLLTLTFSFSAFYYELYSKDVSILGILIIFLTLILLTRFYYRVKEESLLVMASIGIQISTKFVFGKQVSKFIHSQNVSDIVVLEGLKVHEVIFYLAFFLKNNSSSQENILPLFQYTLPPLEHLIRIYEGVQCILLKD